VYDYEERFICRLTDNIRNSELGSKDAVCVIHMASDFIVLSVLTGIEFWNVV
jgi:hypothetical protein